MKYLYPILFIMLLAAPLDSHSETAKKVLIIASNMIDMGDPEKHDARNNLWEVAPPYHVFVSHGYEVDFASSKGGKVEFSMDPIGISSYTIKYEGFLVKANNSLAPEQVSPNDYWAVYIGGGYGPLFDVANNPRLSFVGPFFARSPSIVFNEYQEPTISEQPVKNQYPGTDFDPGYRAFLTIHDNS